MNSIIMSFKDVTFTYTPDDQSVRPAVADLSFSIEEGEWIALVGHNGSGKSTIAKLMNGLLFPQAGEVTAMNLTMSEESLWDIRSQMGMVFQNPDNQFVGATVQDDVAFALENNGVPHEEMVVRVKESLRQVKMEEFLDHEPHHLSGGQKQRVAIAGALALRPRLLILDEATSMLDPQGRMEVIETIRELREETGLTVISITHDLEEAALADRIIVMNAGRKHKEGTPEEVFLTGNELTTLGLDLPFAMRMTHLLREAGVQVLGEHMTEDELVEELWTFYSKK
ncbi:cobalt transporter ATP-binding subunit [Planococcus glaciei]|uniref:Energy-coupling factor ABC transporter ATP-binding protein n=1 Tax=Planococcus glaciei TaxID=459472 RepID=A0A7H8Q902_9BACL|nr:energy-coupling factor ABC transporter ATP-binding protein [Planococcus glaciei]ETP69746.1 cobalt ABC transporter ATP-binding protein [Planococcus glaciei CHR43]KOF09455.1 cobalt transporter ATP-binding subunit [Planococcus glaciei]MBX0316823.1 energy-coupling factor ABC transporter ATP-binding protein [Planococcus glaciei]QKX50484.1 energy-coupling factor ABC transporter ATP-binding protein [Planococcus glaciei]